MILLALGAALVGLHLLDHVLDHPWTMVARLVNLDGEANLPTWYSSGLLLVLALMFGALGRVRPPHLALRPWVAFMLAAVCLTLSLDEVAQIHEWIGRRSDVLLADGTRQNTLVPRTGIWMFLLGPPFLLVVAWLWSRFRTALAHLPRVTRLYTTGFAVYVLSAFGVEMAANLVRAGSPWSAVQVTVEEGGEMLGLTLLIWASLEFLLACGVRISSGDPHPIPGIDPPGAGGVLRDGNRESRAEPEGRMSG